MSGILWVIVVGFVAGIIARFRIMDCFASLAMTKIDLTDSPDPKSRGSPPAGSR